MINRLFFSITLAALVVLCVAIWAVLDSPVKRIVIAGELTDQERAELQRTLGQEPYQGILSTDLSLVGARLQHLPWAKRVSVRRKWPDQLVVSLNRARPVARWGAEHYLSAYGDVLSLPDSYPGLPLFEVAISTPAQAMEVHRLLSQIAARESFVISRLTQNEQAEWQVEFDHGPAVLLGHEQLNQRMHNFLLVHRRVLSGETKDVLYVDARYANGIAVRYADETQAKQDTLLASTGQPIPTAEEYE